MSALVDMLTHPLHEPRLQGLRLRAPRCKCCVVVSDRRRTGYPLHEPRLACGAASR